MKVTIETVSPVTRKIQISIPRERVASELARAYGNLQRGIKMRGFRPGHVPRSVLEARFGNQIEGEVTTKLISDTLENTIEQNSLFVVSQPVIEPGRLTPQADFEYVATVEIKPEVNAAGYTGLNLTREKYELDESAVERQLNSLREQKSNLVVVEEARPLQEGDIARIDYTMAVDGRPLDKGQPRNVHVQVTPGSFLPGFAEQIIGMNAGESRSFELDVPADYSQPGLAGKHLKLNVTLNDIKRREMPELDDEFAKDLEFDTLEALKESIRKDLREHLENSSDLKVRREAAEQLIASNPIELPQGLVNQQIELLAQEQRRQMGRQAPRGRIELTEAMRAEFKQDAEFRLKASLILESIARQESLAVTDEDVNERLEEIARESGQRVEAVRGLYMKNNAIEDLKSKILEEKALEFVMEKANVTDVEKPFSEHAHDHEH